MKGHLEIFESRLKYTAEKLPGVNPDEVDGLFSAFEEALGSDELPFYDVKSGSTLADYYQSQFVRFVKQQVKKK